MARWRVLISVSKDASYRVTGREVSAMTLLSAIRRTVRRFSQFYKQTQTRERVTIAICQIIIRLVVAPSGECIPGRVRYGVVCRCVIRTWVPFGCVVIKALYKSTLITFTFYLKNGRSLTVSVSFNAVPSRRNVIAMVSGSRWSLL